MNEYSNIKLSDLSDICNVSVRNIRYYIQLGLIDKPIGEKRGARYSSKHVEQLLLVQKWQNAGVSLERIKEILHGEDIAVPRRKPKVGTISVKSSIHISEGVELVVDPEICGFSNHDLRSFISQLQPLVDSLHKSKKSGEVLDG